jgi:hypothetical protein
MPTRSVGMGGLRRGQGCEPVFGDGFCVEVKSIARGRNLVLTAEVSWRLAEIYGGPLFLFAF